MPHEMTATGKLSCICGASWRFVSVTVSGADALKREFEAEHTGEGHAPCDARTAARNRRRAEECMKREAAT